jgi:hypothetical protein
MAVIEAIATTYLEADAASVTFTGIPTTYEHLQLRISGKEDATGADGAFGLQFNGDTTSNYVFHRMQGSNTTASGASATVQSGLWLYYYATNGDDASLYGGGVIDILDYRNPNKNTTILQLAGTAGAGTPRVVFESGLWPYTPAVTSIAVIPGFGGNLVRGSEFTLYGLNSA